MAAKNKTLTIFEEGGKWIVEVQNGLFTERTTLDTEADVLDHIINIENFNELEMNLDQKIVRRLMLLADEDIMQQLAGYIQEQIGEKYGFCLLVYENDTAEGRLNYVSNSRREDVVKAMQEFIEKTADGWGTHKP